MSKDKITTDAVNTSSTESTPNTFLEKTIESWLTKTNELGYTLPFAEVLVSQGHAVIHVSKQNAFEQGKDLISIGPDGRVYAYQLKGGNITDRLWNEEIWSEIKKLWGLPVVHPSIPFGTPHTSVLVTNGMLEDSVRRIITDLNHSEWKAAPVQTVVRGQLIRDFVDASAAFLPKNLDDYRAFLDLFFADGRAFVDDQKLSALLEDVLDLDNAGATAEARKRNIAAAILYGSYAISPATDAGNHVACVHALTRVTGYVFALIERYAIPKKHWKDSVALLMSTIDGHAAALEQEFIAGRYDDLARDVWDGTLAIYRRAAAFDVLSAYKLSLLLRGDDQWASIPVANLLQWHVKGQLLWGEAAAITGLNRFWLFHALAPTTNEVFQLISGPLRDILDANGPELETNAFMSPYYDIDTAVELATGTRPEPIGESFRGHSYTVGSLINLLARHDQRATLSELWRRITYLSHTEYHPAAKWEWFRRRGQTGKEVSQFPQQTKSWSELRREADLVDKAALPEILLAHTAFLPFFLLAYPHHVGRNFVHHVDAEVTRLVESIRSQTNGSKRAASPSTQSAATAPAAD